MTDVPQPTRANIAKFMLFAALSPQEQDAIAALSRFEQHPMGTVVFREGEPSKDVFLLESGRVALCTHPPGRGEICYLTITQGEILGWSGLLRGHRHSTARVVETAVLLRMPASKLLELCEADHHIGYVIMSAACEALAERLHDTRLQMLDVFGKPGS